MSYLRPRNFSESGEDTATVALLRMSTGANGTSYTITWRVSTSLWVTATLRQTLSVFARLSHCCCPSSTHRSTKINGGLTSSCRILRAKIGNRKVTNIRGSYLCW